MAKKVVGYIKLQVKAGQANPSPPVGPALGQRGLNIMEFCKAFNAQTQGMEPGLMLPVVITAFADKSFTFVLKSPPATVIRGARHCLAAVHRDLHRGIWRAALHVREQFPGGQSLLQLCRAVELLQAFSQRQFGGGESSAVPRYRSAVLSRQSSIRDRSNTCCSTSV